MNEIPPPDARGSQGSPVAPGAKSGLSKEPAGKSAAGIGSTPVLPAVQIGQPGYKFRFDVDTPQGADERREHERIRKADKRAAAKPAEPPPLPAPALVDSLTSPNGQPGTGLGVTPVEVVPADFVPWVGADVSDFTDELVELTEARRVAEFVAIARDNGMPAKFIAEVEKRSHYPTQSKSALKRTLADCAAKWLNKTGVSSKNKEEVKLLFCMVTIKLQGVRLKKDLESLIEKDRAKRIEEGIAKRRAEEAKAKTP